MSTSPPPRVLRVVAWNLLHGGGPTRTPEAALALASMRPDLCVLSEFRTARGAMLRSVLADSGLCHCLLAPQREERNRVAIVSRWEFMLDSRASIAGLDMGSRSRLLAVRIPEIDLHLLGVHIPDESNPTGRAACWRATVDWARERRDMRAIVCGDFNTSRGGIDPPRPGQTCDLHLGTLASLGYRDAWRLSGRARSSGISWFGPMGKRQRLDALHVSNSLVERVQSACHDVGCVEAGVSDHAPLIVEIGLDGLRGMLGIEAQSGGIWRRSALPGRANESDLSGSAG